MWWQAVQAGTERVVRNARLAVVFAAVLLGLGLMASAAEACSDSKQAIVQATAAHEVEGFSQSPTVFVSTATAQTQTVVKLGQSGSCGGAGCHAHGSACGNACSAGGLVAINGLNSSLLLPTNSVCLSPIDEAEAISAQPPPDLRPPRILI